MQTEVDLDKIAREDLTEEEAAGVEEFEADEAALAEAAKAPAKDEEVSAGSETVTDGDAQKDEGADPEQKQQADEEAAAAAAEAEKVKEAESAAASEEPETAEVAGSPQPAPPVKLPPKVDYTETDSARLEQIGDEADKLMAQFGSGDLTQEEYGTQIKALQEERDGLVAKKARADEHDAIQESTVVDRFTADAEAWANQNPDVQSLFTKAQAEGASEADIASAQAFADIVRSIQEMPAFQDKTNFEIFDAAELNFRLTNPGVLPEPQPDPVPAGDPETTEQKRDFEVSNKERPSPPPTLAKTPVTDVSDASEGKYAVLDAMDGEEQIEALSRMTPAQQQAYLYAD